VNSVLNPPFSPAQIARLPYTKAGTSLLALTAVQVFETHSQHQLKSGHCDLDSNPSRFSLPDRPPSLHQCGHLPPGPHCNRRAQGVEMDAQQPRQKTGPVFGMGPVAAVERKHDDQRHQSGEPARDGQPLHRAVQERQLRDVSVGGAGLAVQPADVQGRGFWIRKLILGGFCTPNPGVGNVVCNLGVGGGGSCCRATKLRLL
jgi:hypothetical protein